MTTPQQLRLDVATLTRRAEHDLAVVFRQAATDAEAVELLHDVLPALIESYGLAAATVAADWYDDLRAEHEVSGRFTAVPADIPDTGAHALVGWAADEATSVASMQALVAGGMQKRITNFSRLTVMDSTIADPRADGWMRIARSNGCRFCRMLAGRGYVFSEQSVKFASHDNCNCGAAPKWAGKSVLVDVDEYRQSLRSFNNGVKTESAKADDARAREWIADNL